MSVGAAFRVAAGAEDFVARTAHAAPDVLSSWTRLKAPGERRPGRNAIDYVGECGFEDGELKLGGRSTRIVAIGADAAAVAATQPLDDVCRDCRERVEEAAATGLSALLALADRNRFTATQLLHDAKQKRKRPKAVRRGIERRALTPQSQVEERLTGVLLSTDFRGRIAAAIARAVDLHVSAFKAQQREIHKTTLRLFLIMAAAGLPLLPAFWLPQLDDYRSNTVMVLAWLFWCGLAALVCGIFAAVRLAQLNGAERRRLGERPADPAPDEPGLRGGSGAAAGT